MAIASERSKNGDWVFGSRHSMKGMHHFSDNVMFRISMACFKKARPYGYEKGSGAKFLSHARMVPSNGATPRIR